MRFHLNYTPPKSNFSLNHRHSSFLIGSCFSENMTAFLNAHKFKTYANPNGILFNPLSIANSLECILHQNSPDEKLILERADQFFSYTHHSSIQAPTKNELIEKIIQERKKGNEFLKKADFLFITFGTAFYYQHLELNTAVANCHKQASQTFEKRRLTVKEILIFYQSLLKELQVLNPKLKVIFTVSPVKHLKDGLIENNLSKSTLLLAVHELIAMNDNCSYFPAYELVTDDLRDYRFYKEDLAHPNDMAVKYVWEKFTECYFDPKTRELNEKIGKLQQALNHRTIQQNETESKKLNDHISTQKEEIRKLFPEIEF